MKILIADDEPVIRRGIRKRLDRYGFAYDDLWEAEDGEQAQRILQTRRVDIAFVDVNMPGLSGLELIERNRHRKVSFVVVSGYDAFAYVKRAWKLGVYNYLLKPIDREEFVETVRALYESRPSGDMLEKILDNIRRNCLDAGYSLTEARRQLGCSESYICRLLKSGRGVGFNDLVNQCRITQAKRWIDEARGRVRIKEISQKAGFNSQQYFSVVFKKYEGMTPAQYLRQTERQEEPDGMDE